MLSLLTYQDPRFCLLMMLLLALCLPYGLLNVWQPASHLQSIFACSPQCVCVVAAAAAAPLEDRNRWIGKWERPNSTSSSNCQGCLSFNSSASLSVLLVVARSLSTFTSPIVSPFRLVQHWTFEVFASAQQNKFFHRSAGTLCYQRGEREELQTLWRGGAPR